MNAGRLFIFSGPSGVGKGTILEALLLRRDRLFFSVSATTRPMRPGEEDGREYHFVSHEAFQDMIAQDCMLEWAEYEGQHYGTPAAPVEEKLREGWDVLLDIETRGMDQVIAKHPDAVTVFIVPPSFAELEERLRLRNTESEEKRRSRLHKGRQECSRAGDYTYLIINDELKTAIQEAEAILTAEACKTGCRLHILKGEQAL